MPQELKNKVLNHPMNHRMIGLTLNHKKRTIVKNDIVSRNDGRTKNHNFALNCSVIHMLI